MLSNLTQTQSRLAVVTTVALVILAVAYAVFGSGVLVALGTILFDIGCALILIPLFMGVVNWWINATHPQIPGHEIRINLEAAAPFVGIGILLMIIGSTIAAAFM